MFAEDPKVEIHLPLPWVEWYPSMSILACSPSCTFHRSKLTFNNGSSRGQTHYSINFAKLIAFGKFPLNFISFISECTIMHFSRNLLTKWLTTSGPECSNLDLSVDKGVRFANIPTPNYAKLTNFPLPVNRNGKLKQRLSVSKLSTTTTIKITELFTLLRWHLKESNSNFLLLSDLLFHWVNRNIFHLIRSSQR